MAVNDGVRIRNPFRKWWIENDLTSVDQVAGHVIDYEGITLVIVKGAGHLTAIDRPRAM